MVNTRKGYPAVPAVLYWNLRQRFVNAPPRGEVTKDYLSTALGVSDKVAANHLPAIRQIGLIDENNRPTELAAMWRDDERYAEATKQIIDSVYPDALKDVSPPDNPDLAAAQRWFLNQTGAGAPRAKELARFYVMLATGDREAPGERATKRTEVTKAPRPTRHRTQQDNGRTPKGNTRDQVSDDTAKSRRPEMPSLSVAIQVYVDKGMTPEQVDHVFASMARHLYGRE